MKIRKINIDERLFINSIKLLIISNGCNLFTSSYDHVLTNSLEDLLIVNNGLVKRGDTLFKDEYVLIANIHSVEF